jgi:hypothetical protein
MERKEKEGKPDIKPCPSAYVIRSLGFERQRRYYLENRESLLLTKDAAPNWVMQISWMHNQFTNVEIKDKLITKFT